MVQTTLALSSLSGKSCVAQRGNPHAVQPAQDMQSKSPDHHTQQCTEQIEVS